ncbi:hypothetical protein C1H46_035772 [Malus baccata]|uniref:Uncharacterized protein n=1 Tax=Malus baccata TaxID=106549 RepID=A0A540KWT4_MALBA|nr:hypothetical protein C1H46_035772 [Malus baccata]
MTDSTDESNATGDHLVIQVREEGERSEREISHVGYQILGENEENEDESFASLIKKELPEVLPELNPTCIFRVPKKLVRDNENAYVPQMVSIGPYHHGRKNLQAMEQVKRWYLQRLLDRKPTPDTSLVKLVKEIRSREEFLRSCYDEKLDHLNSYEFVKMMVVDGCFIIQFLRMDDKFKYLDDPVFSVPGVYSAVKKDLLLLENQLPWKVVDCLFNLTAEPGDPSLHKFNVSLSSGACILIKPDTTERREARHFLDQEIGVKFQCAPFGKAQLDITFRNGVMEIPRMIIEVNTETVLRNLIAYEQCSVRHHECHILSYAMLFNHLIKSPKDLDSLVQKHIIITELSKEETVSLFNRLCNDTERISFSYSELALFVDVYYRHRWLRRSLAGFKKDYLYNPSSVWSISNAVIIVLILTVMQTVYSVLAYYK